MKKNIQAKLNFGDWYSVAEFLQKHPNSTYACHSDGNFHFFVGQGILISTRVFAETTPERCQNYCLISKTNNQNKNISEINDDWVYFDQTPKKAREKITKRIFEVQKQFKLLLELARQEEKEEQDKVDAKFLQDWGINE